MTYSNEIINLCILHFNNKKFPKISQLANVTSMTIYRWLYKYNYFFINNVSL